MEKQPFEWEEEDIQRLIDNQIQESTNLDYKRCGALIENDKQKKQKIIEEMSKDVSSFANAEGGAIIYGVIEDNHLPRYIDGGFDPALVKREWLEDVIDSNVKPKIEGLKIKQIILKEKTPGRVIYIIYIPQSLQGAIQANDYRYYQRRNFKAEPMEDYQVRDVMNRFKYPILLTEVNFKRTNIGGLVHIYEFILILANKGVVTAKAYGMDMLFPINYSPDIIGSPQYIQTFRPEIPFEGYQGYKFRNVKVLFPGESEYIFGGRDSNKLTYMVDDKNWEESYLWKIIITTYADDMPPKKYEHPFINFRQY